MTPREPPAGLAAAASFGCLLEDEERGALADWTMDLAEFVQRLACLDPSLGLSGRARHRPVRRLHGLCLYCGAP